MVQWWAICNVYDAESACTKAYVNLETWSEWTMNFYVAVATSTKDDSNEDHEE